MKPDIFREYAAVMKEFGIASFKIPDGEIIMTHQGQYPGSDIPIAPKISAYDQVKIDEMKSIIKLSDNELLDQLFPEPMQPERTSDEL